MIHYYIQLKKKSYGLAFMSILGLLAWSSCQVTRPYNAPENKVKDSFRSPTYSALDSGYVKNIAHDTTNIAKVKWSDMFTDTMLQQLITEGLQANIDIKIAVERITEAQVNVRLKKAAFLPSLEASISANKQQVPTFQSFGYPRNNTQYDMRLNTDWEIDIWGKLGSAKRVALSQLLATDAAKRAVQTQLIANIASDYYELLALDQQLMIIKKTAENRAEDAAAIAELFENAMLNGVAVVQSKANYYEAELDVPDIEQKIKETENRLSFLVGRHPGAILRQSLMKQQVNYDLNPGIPAQLLAHRPDVQMAEFNFRAAFEETNVARTYFYPALSITAAGGFSNLGWNQWFSSASLFGSIAGGIAQPIFNKGVNKARLSTAQARQQQALYQFEKSLLVASQEVSNALFEYDTAMKKMKSRKKQLEALTQAVAFNKELFLNHQNTNYTDVLTAEQNLLRAELKNIADQSQKLYAVVQLYRALGGGWD
ncbi:MULTISPECIES: efflux transporter outer membrane subunit [unclassified Sphingobacterium]|uniref:efflux transporter outer membrane subunit n=1 Tax=unclassified Sphingobacterium TaxID=2609468 RepID=UPI0010D7D738|nr:MULTISPECIES: efflux transporter outer membrane subunit [unclassified Sphingobacterium]MCS3554167.1 NodT family efflux transporter outer membrane factor (OMF) lipoprotein [Sphingobacterium sp. JUb21]TCR08000.1 NodT family efflux transporter outer membrane factor (OMF) lipoprotein [Sphingobacterium sp. JUb20]